MSEHIISPAKYTAVFIALLVLLVATVGVAYIELGRLWGIIAAMTIATVKAMLVVLYFMHVRYSTKMTWLFAGAGVAWLLIGAVLTLADYLTRNWESIVPAAGWGG